MLPQLHARKKPELTFLGDLSAVLGRGHWQPPKPQTPNQRPKPPSAPAGRGAFGCPYTLGDNPARGRPTEGPRLRPLPRRRPASARSLLLPKETRACCQGGATIESPLLRHHRARPCLPFARFDPPIHEIRVKLSTRVVPCADRPQAS